MASDRNVELTVFPRTPGKNDSRNLRRENRVPAVVYGPKVANSVFCMTENDARKFSSIKFDNVVITLKSEDSKLNTLKVLKKRTDYHKVNQRPIHLDFYAVDLTKKVRVHVALRFEGKAEGTREGGVFNAIRRDIEIEVLPTEIPEAIVVDVTNVMLNGSLHVSEITVPANVKVLTPASETICNVAEVKEEVVVAAVVDPAAAAAAPAGAAAAPGAAPAAAAPAADAKADKK